jgi:hypothetical protein
MVQVVEHLPIIHQALSSNPNISKKQPTINQPNKQNLTICVSVEGILGTFVTIFCHHIVQDHRQLEFYS